MVWHCLARFGAPAGAGTAETDRPAAATAVPAPEGDPPVPRRDPSVPRDAGRCHTPALGGSHGNH